MCRLVLFGQKKFSLTVMSDAMRYLGKGALTKKWSDDFSKPLASYWLSLANKIANYLSCQIVVLFSLSNCLTKTDGQNHKILRCKCNESLRYTFPCLINYKLCRVMVGFSHDVTKFSDLSF